MVFEGLYCINRFDSHGPAGSGVSEHYPKHLSPGALAWSACCSVMLHEHVHYIILNVRAGGDAGHVRMLAAHH